MRHLIDPTDLSVAEIGQIIALAEDIIANRAKYSEACKGKKLATLFYEPSTRTRLSFTSAMLELGGSVIGFSDAASSSVSKGETVADTVRVIRCFADIIAMRHFKEGAPLVGSQYAGIPVINAGTDIAVADKKHFYHCCITSHFLVFLGISGFVSLCKFLLSGITWFIFA